MILALLLFSTQISQGQDNCPDKPISASYTVKSCQEESGTNITIIVDNAQTGWTYRIFNAASGGSQVGSSMIAPGNGTVNIPLTVTGTGKSIYYVEAEYQGCINEGGRTEFEVEIQTAPTSAAIEDTSVCYAGNPTIVDIDITNSTTGYQYEIFNETNQLLASETGSSMEIKLSPSFENEGEYNLTLVVTNPDNIHACRSASSSFKIDIAALSEKPEADNYNITECGQGSNTPIAIVINNAIKNREYLVYTEATGGTPVTSVTASTDGNLTIPLSVSGIGTFAYYIGSKYLECVNNGGRTRFNVVILPAPPDFAVGTVNANHCIGQNGSTTVNLSVTPSNSNYLYAVFASATGTDTLTKAYGHIDDSPLNFTIGLSGTGNKTLYVTAVNPQTNCSTAGGRLSQEYIIYPLPDTFTVTPTSQEYCIYEGSTEVELIVSGAEAGNKYHVVYSGTETVIGQGTAINETLSIRFNETTTGVKNYTLYAETANGCQTPVNQRITTNIIVNIQPGKEVAWISWTNRDDNKTFEICGDPQEFSVEFNHRLGYCTFPDTTLVLELAPGIEYVPGSLSMMPGTVTVTEHNLDDLNKPVLWVSSISGGQKAGFYYQARATMGAFDLFYDNSNVPYRKYTYRYGQLLTNITDITGFQGKWGDIRFIGLSNNTVTVNQGETFSLDINIKNAGNGAVELAQIDLSEYLPYVAVISSDKGTLNNNIITLTTSDFPGNTSLASEQEISLTVTMLTGSCVPGTMSNNIKALWGCGSLRQSDSHPFTIIANSGVPVMEYKLGTNLAPRDHWEDVSHDTLCIINNGNGIADSVIIELKQMTRYVDRLNNTSYAEFLLNTIRAQKGKKGSPISPVIRNTTLHSTGLNRKFFPGGANVAVDLELPFEVNPKDTVILSFSEGFIDLAAFNASTSKSLLNAYRRGWAYNVKYIIPCSGDKTVYSLNAPGNYTHGRTGNYGNNFLNVGSEIASFSESTKSFEAVPNTLSDTQTSGTLTFKQASYYMTAFINPTGAFVEIITEHPIGVTLSNPRLFAGNANRPFIGSRQEGQVYIAQFEWTSAWSGRVEYNVDFSFDCDAYRTAYPRGNPLYSGFEFTFQSKSFKSQADNGLPSQIHTSDRIHVECIDENVAGVISEQFIAERLNVSLQNDDHIPPSDPDRKKMWYGDTVITRYKGSIKSGFGFTEWDYVTVLQNIPLSATEHSLLDVTARIKRAADNSTIHLNLMKDGSVIITNSVTQSTITGGRQHAVKLTKALLGNVAFQDGDSVIIETSIRYQKTNGVNNMQVTAEFFASNTASIPSDNLDKYSGTYTYASPITAYYIRFSGTGSIEDYIGCNEEILLSRNFTVQMNSPIVGIDWNFFTEEFREIGQVRKIYITKPEGYILKNNQVNLAIVSLNSPKAYNLPPRQLPVTVEGNEWVVDLNDLYETGTIKPEDETFTVELGYIVIPTCNTPAGEVTNAISIDFKGSMSQYPGTSRISIPANNSTDVYRYYPPALNHTGGGNASQIDVTSGKISWPVFISNNSTHTNARKVWVTAPMPASSPMVRIDSIMSGNIKYLPDVNGFFDLGDFSLATTKEYRVCGTLLDCGNIPGIDLFYYWSCGTLPTDIDEVECKNTVNLTVQAPKGELITTFTDIGGAITHCQPISYSLSLTNNLEASLKDLQVIFDQMPNGLSYVDGSLEYSVGESGIYTQAPASAVSIIGGKIIFDVSKIGVTSLSRNTIHLRYDLITNQGFISGSKYQVEVIGKQWCGEAIHSNIIVPVSIYLDGFTGNPPFNMSVEITPLTVSTCTQNEYSLKASVKHIVGTPTNEGNINNEIILDLPIGLEFVETPAGLGNNNSLANERVQTLPNGSQRIRWDMPVFTLNMQHNYEFKVRQANSLECSDINRIELTTAIVEYVVCDGTPSEVFVITGTSSSDIILDKYKIEVLDITKSETTPNCTTTESATFVSLRLQNNGKAISSGTPVVVEFFHDINNDGIFESTELIGHTVSTSGMASGAQVTVSALIRYAASLAPNPSLPFFAVVRTGTEAPAPTQCVCNTSFKQFSTTSNVFPDIHLTLNGIPACEGRYTNATATTANGYSYRWSLTPTQGAIMTNTGNRSSIYWHNVDFLSGTSVQRILKVTVTHPVTQCYREASETITVNYTLNTEPIYRLPNLE